MKMDQIAFYAANDELADQIKYQFGLVGREWIKDTVTANSSLGGTAPQVNIAELQFNYDLGIELEIIRYISGKHWHNENPLDINAKLVMGKWISVPFISHVGIHLEDDEKFPEIKTWKLVQETMTIKHTSEYLTKEGSPGFGRTYHYRIYEMSPGSYIKYIKRLHKAP
jgi:hypothetical protein